MFISILVNRQVSWTQAMGLVAEMKSRTGYRDTLSMFTELSVEEVEAAMFQKPALHRHRYQAKFCCEAMTKVRDELSGDVRNLWASEGARDVTGSELLKRICEFKGYGNKTSTLLLRVLILTNGVRLFDSLQSLMPSDDRHVRRVGARLGLFPEDAPVKVINDVAIRLDFVCPATLDALFIAGTDWCKASSPMCHGNENGEPCPMVRVCNGEV